MPLGYKLSMAGNEINEKLGKIDSLAEKSEIPTKVSDLTNDKGYLTSIPSEYITESELEAKKYLTSYTETDPTVPAWAKASSKPSYTKSEVGLGNVDNTSDTNKPVSTAQATAIADAKKAGTDAQTNLTTHTNNKSNPHGVTKAQIELGNVDNVKQYSASNPPPYPVTKVNNKIGAITLSASDVGADASGTASSAVSAHNTATNSHADIRQQISQLSSEIVDIKGNGIPDYVKTEAESVIDRVIAAQDSRTFTFAAITDLHYGNGGYTDGILHACQALKYIDERVKLDAVTVLGDYTDGYPSTSLTDAMADYRAVNALLSSLRFAPNLRQMGNHDYYADNIPITRRLIQKYSDDVIWGNIDGGYFHKDFEDYKLRVIVPNCNENNVMDSSTNKPTGSISITAAQAQWFADTLAELNTKSDAAEWQVLVLSHQPLDWYDSQTGYALARIVDAYHEGKTFSNSAVSCNFAGKNSAKFICNIHGHIHNLLVDKVHTDNVVNGVKSKVYRMCTPEACIGRANQYDGAWKEATTYAKTTNTADDTSFVVYCINLDTHTIDAICYGAGYDRSLVYHTEAVVYNITQTLSNVSSSNAAVNIVQGGAFSTTLTAQSGYELGDIKVTMGGVDVTATALSGSTISISNVTGDIVITATATLIPVEPAENNQILNAVDASGNPFNGGKGYKSGYRLNSSGAESALAGSLVSGFIPYNSNVKKLRIKGYVTEPTSAQQQYIHCYDESFTMNTNWEIARPQDLLSTYPTAFTFEFDSDGVGVFTVDMEAFEAASKTYAPVLKNSAYIRVNIVGANENSFSVTFDEETTGDEPTPTYTNLIPQSINADGSQYVGTNGEDGYKSGYRLNSSGVEVTYEGLEVTGFIPVTLGDVLYFKDIKITGKGAATYNAQEYLAFYDSNKNKLASGQISYATPWFEANPGNRYPNTYYVKIIDTASLVSWNDATNNKWSGAANMAYFRISAEEITDASIITKNEPIV